MADRIRIRVDRDTCIGSGVCTGSAPQYFRLVDGKSQPISEVVDFDDEVLSAAETCPSEAITVTDAESGEHLAP